MSDWQVFAHMAENAAETKVGRVNLLKLFVATGLMLSGATAADAQAKPKSKSSSVARPSAQAYAASVADVDCSNVLQKQHSIGPLIPLVRSVLRSGQVEVAKNEFETTAQFEQRRATAYVGEFGTPRLIFALNMDPVWHTAKFDADRGVLQIKVPFEPDIYNSKWGDKQRFNSIQLFRDSLSTDHFEGSNAYGASVEVESETEMRAALLFMNGSGPASLSERKPPIEVAASPDAARKFKADGKMLVVASLRPPYVTSSFERRKATIDYPYETRLTSYGLYVQMECIVFASGTEEIHRISFQ